MKSKVFFTDLRTTPGNDLMKKLERLIRRAGIADIDFDGKFTAVKIHFGEPGNLSYLRPNYARALVDVIKELGGKTPLEYAKTPNMDALAGQGVLGLAKTVPDTMKPGSDVANLAVMGYDPLQNYSGRSPLEALSVGVDMKDTDIVFRCNIVTLSENEPYAEKVILDHSSGEISTQDADILMDAVREAFQNKEFKFYTGTSYRHCLVLRNALTGTSYRHITIWDKGEVLDMEPPHDHLGQVIGPYLPENPLFREMMEKSFDVLNNHPLNLQRAAQGKNKANSLWFWGAGTKPSIQTITGRLNSSAIRKAWICISTAS